MYFVIYRVPANISRPKAEKIDNPAANRIKAVENYARHHFATETVVISAQIESELVDLGENEATDYLRGLGVEDSGVHALVRAVYHLLGLRAFLTTGEKGTRAWTIHRGGEAAGAAGVTDSAFERDDNRISLAGEKTFETGQQILVDIASELGALARQIFQP